MLRNKLDENHSTNSHNPQPGFIMPPQAQYPNYPPQQPAGYPPPQPGGYPPPQYTYPPNQPFPAPIQHQPNQQYSQSQYPSWITGNFFTHLQNATSFHVKQKVELVEAILGWETGNKYTVRDNSGNKLFYVGEESNICGRQLCNARRPFTLTVKDGAGQNIIVMDRPLDCSCCFGLFCPDKLTVSTPSGQILGTVSEEFNLLYPSFNINDATGRAVLKIEGPLCPLTFGACSGGVIFRVMNMAGVSVGTISKEWSGFVRELFTDADYFSMSFPIDLDPSVKAVCLGALFLIDYEYFESGATNSAQGGRRLFA